MTEFPEQIYRHATYSTIRAWRGRHGRYRLVGSRCQGCGQIWFPPRSVCTSCTSRELEDYECSHEGEVVCHWDNSFWGGAVMGYGEIIPSTPVVVRLKDGVHIVSQVIEISPQEIYDGMPVRMVLRKHKRESNSNWMYGYKFVPMEKKSTEG